MILCPHCERPLEGHDGGHCARRMSRRFFFGLCAGAVGAIVTPEQPGITIATWTRSAERAYFASELGLYKLAGDSSRHGKTPTATIIAQVTPGGQWHKFSNEPAIPYTIEQDYEFSSEHDPTPVGPARKVYGR